MKIINKIKNFLWLIAAGSLSVFLAACYGVTAEMQKIKTVRVTDNSGNPIPNLQLSLCYNTELVKTTRTDSAGVGGFEFYSDEELDNYTLTVEDVDGEENLGEFSSQKLSLQETTDLYDITVTP
ncbi:MAG: hypothetical protein ACP5FK_03910 [bacterium]